MSSSEATLSSPCNILISDRAGAVVLSSLFESMGLVFSDVFPEGRNWQRRVLAKARKKLVNVVLVPTLKFDAGTLSTVAELAGLGANIVVWGAIQAPSQSRQWIIERLLEQNGAIICMDPAVVAVVCRLLSMRERILERGVRVRGARNSIHDRILAALEHAEISRGDKGGFGLTVDPKLGIKGEEMEQSLGSPLILATALARLIESACPETGESYEIIRDSQALELILEPPRRILSEVVSKKILAAFGMSFPSEQLCQSPSEAARFAATIDGPVVLKLVKPKLERKAEKGAVICDIEGKAAVRRAAQQLEGLNIMLGPPPALGILTSEQVETTCAIWVEMVDDADFGRIVRGGVGNRPAGPPSFVLKTPARLEQVVRSTKQRLHGFSHEAVLSLCRGIATFTQIVDFLGDRIERAEIHPMVALEDRQEPLVLDALFTIAD